MILYLVVPCYNEEEVLETSAETLLAKLDRLQAAGRIEEESRIVLVNDGSSDRTAQIMSRLHEQNSRISCIHFSANFGHQNAVLAGYHFAADKCDAAISIDADLQQDIEAIDLFLDEFEKGSRRGLRRPQLQRHGRLLQEGDEPDFLSADGMVRQ